MVREIRETELNDLLALYLHLLYERAGFNSTDKTAFVQWI